MQMEGASEEMEDVINEMNSIFMETFNDNEE